MSVLNGNDEIIMLAILALGKNAYGATMMRYLTKITGKEWSIGAIYDPLYRLEKKDMCALFIPPRLPKRGADVNDYTRLPKRDLKLSKSRKK